MDTQQQIQLGQAQNLAAMTMQGRHYFSETQQEEDFKNLTRLYLKWGNDLREEFNLKTREEPVITSGSDAKALRPIIDPKYPKQAQPSPKQKYCPKCKTIVPKTWKNHKECGWVE